MRIHVKITKVRPSEKPDRATPKKSEHVDGTSFGTWEGYELKGHLLYPIKVGEIMRVARYERNGVAVEGFFNSSIVTKITRHKKMDMVETRNSVYKVELLD